MGIESKSSVVKKAVGLSMIIEVIVFFVAFLLCSSQPTWNNFLSNLFLVGLAFIFIGPIFFGNGVADNNESIGYINFNGFYPAKQYQPVSVILMLSCVFAGIIAIALSIVISLMFSN